MVVYLAFSKTGEVVGVFESYHDAQKVIEKTDGHVWGSKSRILEYTVTQAKRETLPAISGENTYDS